MSVFEIPLTPEPQTFSISLVGTVYRLTINWNTFGPYWVLDIADAQGNFLLCGLPMVPGYDLLAQFAYIGIVGNLYVTTDHDPDAMPTFDSMGVTSHLYFETLA